MQRQPIRPVLDLAGLWLLVVLGSTPGLACPQAPHATLAGLTARDAKGCPLTAWDVGTIRYGQVVSRSFRLRNDSRSAARVGRIVTAVGCTARLPGGVRFVEPGGSVPVSVSLDTGRLPPPMMAQASANPFSRHVYVYLADQPVHPVVALELRGHLASGVTFEPDVANFGRVSRAAGAAIKVRVWVDRTIYDNSTTSLVAKPHSRTRVRLMPTSAVAPVRADRVCRDYRLSVPPNAPVGAFSEVLGVCALRRAAGGPSGRRQVVTVSLPVIGEVVGSVRAQPAQIVFGLVRRAAKSGATLGDAEEARRRTRWVMLVPSAGARSDANPTAASNKSASARPAAGCGPRWANATVRVERHGIAARLIMPTHLDSSDAPAPPPGGRPAAGACWLKVVVLDDAEVGRPLPTPVTVSLPGGEMLVLPVIGQVE